MFCHAGCTFEEVIAALGLTRRDLRPTRRRVVRQKGKVAKAAKLPPPPALENQDLPLRWHDQLMLGQGRAEEFREYLTTQRGLTLDTLSFFRIGFDSRRITIPIRYRGKWRAVRRYMPNAPEGVPKMLNVKGFGSSILAFTETLAGNAAPVLATEGELDAMLAWQEAAGAFAVVTGTGGAGVPPKDMSLLNSREVFVCFDVDDAGRAGAVKFADAARAAGASAYVLDLSQVAP